MKFSEFILNEDQAYLGHKVGDILTAAHDLQDDIENLGARQVSRMADTIVNHIRKILHQQWQPVNRKYLEELQAIAVMIKKAIEEKKEQGTSYDLKETIKMCIQKLEDVSTKLGIPVNKATAPPVEDGEAISDDDFELTDDSIGKKPDNNKPQEEEDSESGF